MAKLVNYVKDTLVSLVNNLGKQGLDKAASTVYVMPIMTDADLITAYRSAWLAKKVINIPAFDSFRRWRNWQADASDITLIEKEEKRLGLQRKLLECMVKARLFGGAALYIGTGDPNPELPLEPERIGKGGIKFLNLFRRADLTPGDPELDPESPYYNEPKWYELRVSTTVGLKIHPSRLIIFKGEPLPDEELVPSSHGRGWGDSVLQTVLNTVTQTDGTLANIASLVFEAKVDVVKVPGLMENLSSPDYETRLLNRFSLANVAKGVNQMLLLDSEEEYEQKTAAFAQLPEIATTFLQVVSGAADIPLTRLLGQSPGGMNSTGESDLRNYYDLIQAMQNVSVTPALQIFDECLIRSATGARNEDTHYIWSSLWQITDKERAEIGKIDADTINVLNSTGLFPQEALAKAATNMLIEHSIMPGLDEEIDDAGGLPDYEAEAEAEAAQALAAAQAKAQPARPTDAIMSELIKNAGLQLDMFAEDGNMKSLYVRRDVLNAGMIRKHYEEQGLPVNIDNLHVTIIHSKKPVDWFTFGEAWNDEIIIKGGARDHALFGPPGIEDSLVLMIKSNQIEWRFAQFVEGGAQSSYTTIQPHITLRYVQTGTEGAMTADDFKALKPYVGTIELGPEIFEEVKAKANS